MDYKQYTSVERMRGKWCTYLVVDQQSFCVASVENRNTAVWYADMLSIALERLCESRLTPAAPDALPCDDCELENVCGFFRTLDALARSLYNECVV